MTTILDKHQQEEFYNEIVKLYEFAEKIIDDLHSTEITNPEKQTLMLTPVIKQISESADMLADTYLRFLENNSASKEDINIIGKSVRRFCLVLEAYLEELKKNP